MNGGTRIRAHNMEYESNVLITAWAVEEEVVQRLYMLPQTALQTGEKFRCYTIVRDDCD